MGHGPCAGGLPGEPQHGGRRSREVAGGLLPPISSPTPRSWPTTTAPPRRSRWCQGVRSTGREMQCPPTSPPVASITVTHCAAKVSSVKGGTTRRETPAPGTYQLLTSLLSLCSQPVHAGSLVPRGQPDPPGHHHRLLLHLQVGVPGSGRVTLRLHQCPRRWRGHIEGVSPHLPGAGSCSWRRSWRPSCGVSAGRMCR